ncbi:hypothetical protein IHQ56_07105 [Methylobacillus flagellatus]|uniref:hypothetical protein n=1 Tax=Methylobacillus flagellatus TaxID=405 RepID=UPI0028539803|nr:hypothetical protein [Methylobacillus flagellatus]MDR5171579.1 hypothetical protein [Methylobacillus flagellatus]
MIDSSEENSRTSANRLMSLLTEDSKNVEPESIKFLNIINEQQNKLIEGLFLLVRSKGLAPEIVDDIFTLLDDAAELTKAISDYLKSSVNELRQIEVNTLAEFEKFKSFSAMRAELTFSWGRKFQKENQARENALKRLANDPKQKDKEFVKSCWEAWQENKNHYASKAAFSRDMLEKCEHLTSQKKIEDWCRTWEKE